MADFILVDNFLMNTKSITKVCCKKNESLNKHVTQINFHLDDGTVFSITVSSEATNIVFDYIVRSLRICDSVVEINSNLIDEIDSACCKIFNNEEYVKLTAKKKLAKSDSEKSRYEQELRTLMYSLLEGYSARAKSHFSNL